MSTSPCRLIILPFAGTSFSANFSAACLLLCLTLVASETTKAQSFSTPMTYSVGENPNSGTSGDFNGDGKPDLAIGNVLNRNVSVLLNNGDGTFGTAVNYLVDFNPEALATGDFNIDGKLDLAVGNFLGGFTSTGNISILLGNGNGTFQTAVNYDASSPTSLQAADLNNDGKLDLVAASWNADKASVLLGNGDGTFQAVTTYAAGTQPRGVWVADFNGDGKPDLAVTNILSNNVSILLGNGNGTFQAPLNSATPSGPTGVAASDLNGDSNQDLVVAAVSSGAVLVLLGNGNGSFQTPVGYPVGSEPLRLELADFNGDGRKDVVVVNVISNSFSVLRGNTDGTFQSGMTRAARSGSFSPVVSDFDTDGKPDLAVLSNSLDVVDVLLNSPSAHGVAVSATAGAPIADVLVANFKDYDTSKTAGSFTATVNWGDGTTTTPGVIAANGSGGFNVTGGHTYAREGIYGVSVQIADANQNFASATSAATVADAPLTATGKTINAVRGLAFTAVVANFTDADPNGSVADFSAVINWGDAANSAGTISSDGSGGFNVSGSHSYSSSGSFPVTVTILDVGGSTAIANSTANVSLPAIQFSLVNYSVNEGAGSVQITVIRIGDPTGTASVEYSTSDQGSPTSCGTANGKASSRCDFTTSVGSLRFAAGESSKTFTVLISQDNFVEGPETIGLKVSNVNGDGSLGTPTTATLTIVDDATEPATNPVDSADAFVRQHYHDFLNREPDAAGLAFWSNQITECEQPGATCSAEIRRINVSAAFFLSIEFQETGYLAYRFYKSAYGDINGTPVPLRFVSEFLPDTQQIGKDVVIGQPGAEQQLEVNKVAYALDFVSRARFTSAYPTTLTPAQFVDALFVNAGVTPSASDRDAAINEFGGAGNTADVAARARAVRRVAENSTLRQQETNKAFVLMQYFGYLRRNPNDPPEANLDFGGYNFWLGKLNEFNGNFVNAEMVKAFIVSGEYRQRFGP